MFILKNRPLTGGASRRARDHNWFVPCRGAPLCGWRRPKRPSAAFPHPSSLDVR